MKNQELKEWLLANKDIIKLAGISRRLGLNEQTLRKYISDPNRSIEKHEEDIIACLRGVLIDFDIKFK